jgi:hypothetical protein
MRGATLACLGIIPRRSSHLFLVLVLGGTRWEGGQRKVENWDTPPLRVARVALVVLRAVQTGSSTLSKRRYTIHPSSRPVDDSEALTFLADYPKPVSCSSSVVEGYLSISCRSLSGGDVVRMHETLGNEMIPELRQAVRGVNPQSQPVTDESLLALQGAGESLVVSFGDFAAFLRDFRIPFSSSIVPPDDGARLGGAVAVLTIAPPARLESP